MKTDYSSSTTITSITGCPIFRHASVLKYIIACCFSFFIVSAYSQENVFMHYGLKEGLSQSVVNCIFQDSEGYMWFGTQNGLNRFDGYNFKKFISNPLDTNSISDNRIFAITEDASGNLWIGTINGLIKYNMKTNIFSKIEFKPKNNLYSQRAVNGLVSGKNGEIYISTTGLLTILYPENNELEHYSINLPFDGSVYDQNRPVLEDKNGDIWLGTQFGLSRFSRKTKQFAYFNKNSNPAISGNDVTALYQDGTGNIWVGTSEGLCMLDPLAMKSLSFVQSADKQNLNYLIRAICQDNKGNLWVAMENGGLFKLQLHKNSFSFIQYTNNPNNQNGICHNIIYSLLLDKSGVLWAGTLNGIDKTDLKQKKFSLYRKSSGINSLNIADNVMAALYKNDDGLIWIGTWGSGLNIYDRNSDEIQHYASIFNDYRKIPNDFIHVIFKDKQNRIWIGTRDGLLIYDKQSKRFFDYRHFFSKGHFPDFKSNRIYCMLETGEEKFVVGTGNGLHILDIRKGNTQSFYAEDSTISGNLIYSVMEDTDRDIWIATTNGLDCYNPSSNTFRHFRKDASNKNSIIDNFIVSLCLSSDGKIWVGTNSGIGRLDKKTGNFEYFPEFPSNIVYDIIEDNNHDIWLSSGLGLSKFDSRSREFINYDTEDGLQSLEFNIKACFKSKDGEIFFGGMNGFNSFYPDSLQMNRFISNVVITSLEKENLTGKHFINVNNDEEIVLTHQDYAFSIDFASLDYTHPEKNKYAYEMIGLSEKRIEYGNRRHVTFLNLPPGDYEFRVYGTNSDGIWNTEPSVLKIKVLPPWWMSSYALTFYIIILLLLIILYIKLRERRLKHEKRVLEEKVKDRTREISMQKDEIQAQRDEIEKQKNFVTEQRDHIAQKNLEISDSINYAKRIQSAVMPSKKEFKESFAEFFLFYLPKDIVSGDFYWIKKMNEKCYFAVADCTGHGVPGAFVSLLGISFLNEIVQSSIIESAGDFLDKLRSKMKEALQQTGRKDEAKDGLDISLVCIDYSKMNLEFAGANSHGLLFKKEKLIQLMADRMPIGIHGFEKAFGTFSIQLEKGDVIYLFTDGFMDQFGQKSRRKFMAKNFKLLIEDIHYLPLIEQRDKLSQTFTEWKGSLDQIDDVTILGVMI